MNWKSTARRSAVVVGILILSVVCALLYQIVWDEIDRQRYPRQFSEYVSEYSAQYGVPEYVIYAVIKVESDFVSNAESHAGAIGLMQIHPENIEWITMRLKRNSESGMMYDPRTNIEYGIHFAIFILVGDVGAAAYTAHDFMEHKLIHAFFKAVEHHHITGGKLVHHEFAHIFVIGEEGVGVDEHEFLIYRPVIGHIIEQ